MKAIVFAVLLSACAGITHDTETLPEAIRSYNDGVRWGRYGVAANKVPARERADFIADMDERADKLKITDYDVVDISARGDREAKVRIKIGWYTTDEGTVHETHAIQTWERQGKLWFMVGEERVRGTEMPGLPEPAVGGSRQKHEDSRTSRRADEGRGIISP